jgi:hypothetical protein
MCVSIDSLRVPEGSTTAGTAAAAAAAA